MDANNNNKKKNNIDNTSNVPDPKNLNENGTLTEDFKQMEIKDQNVEENVATLSYNPIYQNEDGSLTEEGEKIKNTIEYNNSLINFDSYFDYQFRTMEKELEERWNKTPYKKREFDKTGGDNIEIEEEEDSEKAQEAYKAFKENYDKHINIIIDAVTEELSDGNGMVETWDNDNYATKESFKRHLLTQDKWNGAIINGGSVREDGTIDIDLNDDDLYGCHGIELLYDPIQEKVIKYYGLVG